MNSYQKLETGLKDIEEMIELCEMEEDEDTADTIVEDFEKLKNELEDLRISTLLTGKYDQVLREEGIQGQNHRLSG